MAMTFDQLFAADPANPANVAQNASVTIFAPGDSSMTPLTITDPDGQPLANPLTVNANGFGSAFAHATLDRVAWAGGGFTGYFTSYEGMKAEAVAAKTASETASTSAASSATAAANSAALVGAPADAAMAAAAGNAASQYRVTTDALYPLLTGGIVPDAKLPARLSDTTLNTTILNTSGADEFNMADIAPQASALIPYGTILTPGTGADFDAGKIESPDVLHDPISGKYAMLYTAYNTGLTQASCGLAYSTDGVTWTKWGQTFGGSGINGTPDKSGVTGIMVVPWGGLFYKFYIGLDSDGYEGGAPTLCLATAPHLQGPWTRLGAIISPSGASTGITAWRKQKIWRANIVKKGAKWYLFFNATGQDNTERMGYATADNLLGPWTVDDANSPILPDAGHTTDMIWGGDPFIIPEGGHYRADFSCADASWGATGNFYATTPANLFPLGWTIRGQTTSGDVGPFKPFIVRRGGQYWHYGTASSGISLAVAGAPVPRVGKAVSTDTGSAQLTLTTTYQAPAARTLTVSALPGEWVRLGLLYIADNQAGDVRADVQVLNEGAVVGHVSGLTSTDTGVAGWGAIGSAYQNAGGTILYKVKTGDVKNGTVTFNPVFRVSASGRIVKDNVNDAITFSAEVL